jgi:hypothetical protein
MYTVSPAATPVMFDKFFHAVVQDFPSPEEATELSTYQVAAWAEVHARKNAKVATTVVHGMRVLLRTAVAANGSNGTTREDTPRAFISFNTKLISAFAAGHSR